MKSGCDVASYQGTIDFVTLKDEVRFVIAKATEGVGFVDPSFARNWSEPKRVGMQRGAYHFARPDLGNSPDAEAAYFLSQIGPLEGGDILALDYEANWPGDVVGWCKAWLDDVRAATGFTPLIYLNLSLVRAHDWQPVIDAGYPLWLAYYDGDPTALPKTQWPEIAMKQWTSSGELAGIPSPRVDLNTAFGGTSPVADLPQYAGKSADVTCPPGEVSLLQAFFTYPDGSKRALQRKVWAHKPGRYIVRIYPPVDPDADPTENLDADPAIFVVDVTTA